MPDTSLVKTNRAFRSFEDSRRQAAWPAANPNERQCGHLNEDTKRSEERSIWARVCDPAQGLYGPLRSPGPCPTYRCSLWRGRKLTATPRRSNATGMSPTIPSFGVCWPMNLGGGLCPTPSHQFPHLKMRPPAANPNGQCNEDTYNLQGFDGKGFMALFESWPLPYLSLQLVARPPCRMSLRPDDPLPCR